MEELYSILIKNIPEQNIYLNEPMNKHTSFRIGGSADIFIKINTQEELKYILKVVQNERIPLTIIGNGTNILVRDNGIRGIVAKINIQKFEIETTGEDVIVTLGAGEPLGKVAQNLVKHSIQGFEFASGIPGTIGGAIKMNAGAYGGEFKDIVKDVTYMDAVGNIETIQNNECNFSYRHSLFSNKNYIILEATLMLQKGNINDIKSKMEEYAESRRTKQPINMPSAGSTFKRPEGAFAGKLIMDAGLRGFRVGDAMVSEKHCGFVVNAGRATAEDVCDVIAHVQKVVLEKFGKKLEPEIRFLGFDRQRV